MSLKEYKWLAAHVHNCNLFVYLQYFYLNIHVQLYSAELRQGKSNPDPDFRWLSTLGYFLVQRHLQSSGFITTLLRAM